MALQMIAIGGQKGGAGKSTVTSALAVAWREEGVAVYLVDADPQGTLATWFAQREEEEEGLSLVRAKDDVLKDVLDRLRKDVKDGVVLIDLDGRNSRAQRIAMVLCDVFIVPVRAGAPDLWALGEMYPLWEEARRHNPRLQVRVLLNGMNRTQMAREVRAALRVEPVEVLDSELGDRVDFREAIAVGEGPTKTAPHEKASREVRSLMRELESLTARVAKETA
jgi:chromosome partitioning protein